MGSASRLPASRMAASVSATARRQQGPCCASSQKPGAPFWQNSGLRRPLGADPLNGEAALRTARLNQRMGPTQLTLRTRPDFERFFDGLEMVEPGVVPLPEWHGPGSEYPIPCYAGMGRKP